MSGSEQNCFLRLEAAGLVPLAATAPGRSGPGTVDLPPPSFSFDGQLGLREQDSLSAAAPPQESLVSLGDTENGEWQGPQATSCPVSGGAAWFALQGQAGALGSWGPGASPSPS